MRPRTGLGMPLKTERRFVDVLNALQRAVEQRAVRGAQRRRQRGLIDGKAMVLAGDHHPARVHLLDRMIRAVMAEFHLDRTRAAGKSEQLMPQADAEYRNAGVDNRAYR